MKAVCLLQPMSKLLAEHQLQMTVHQGVYHQVKRMLAAVGNKVEHTTSCSK